MIPMTRPARALPASRIATKTLAALALAAAALFTMPARPAAAQEPATAPVPADTLVEVRLNDGSVLIGRVVEQTPERLVVVTQGGTRVELDRAQVRSVTPVQGRVVDGDVWHADPNDTRLFFGPTARALPQGVGYFGAFELLVATAGYGVTDRLTLGGGVLVVPEEFGELLLFAPKLEVVRRPGFRAAVGAIAGFSAGDEESVGVLYGVGTLGSSDGALTVGASFPFVTDGSNGDIGTDPLLLLGGELRLSRSVKLITENHITTGEGGLFSGGVRFFGERLSADFGLGTLRDGGGNDNIYPLPIVNFSYTFGRR